MSANVDAAAAEVAQTLDGTYGKTWTQVADELDATAREGERVYADPAALAGLIRALHATAALP